MAQVRSAYHAGSWYTDDREQLTEFLDRCLSAVPKQPQPGARVVISPHAGFAYSGPAAAWAYKCLDLSKAGRIFILHPSHHHYLRSAALPVCTAYETPLADEPLPLDVQTIKEIGKASLGQHRGQAITFETMSQHVDEAEHSGEMQLPYIHRLLQMLYPGKSPASYPPLVPIMIGNTSSDTEKTIGKILAPYIADAENAFVISSDFCHWGSRFQYTYYLPDAPSPAISATRLPNEVMPEGATAKGSLDEDVHKVPTLGHGINLNSKSKPPTKPAIYESIAHADRACMCAIASGEHNEFLRVLQETGNTVCGRHPIGAFMAGVEELEKGPGGRTSEDRLQRRFRFMRYERSSDAKTIRDSSVSYVSAFAIL